MNLNRIFFVVLISLNTAVFAQKYKGDNWASIPPGGSGTLTIIYIEQFGLIHKDKTGKMKGVCVDILNDFTKYLKDKYGKSVRLDFAGEEPDFAKFLNIAQHTPGVLGVTNTTITEERKQIFKFSPPFMLNRLVLLTNSTVPTVSSFKELPSKFAGFSAQVIAGSLHVDYIQKIKTSHMPALEVKYVTTGRNIIKNLTTDKKAFTIIDMTEFIEAAHNKLPVKNHPVDVGIVEELGFVMSKQSDWDVLFKEFITPEYKNSTRYRQIITENLSSSFMTLVK